MNLSKYVNDLTEVKAPDFFDPVGPYKRDIPDFIIRGYLEMMPRVALHIDAIEDHLAEGLADGKAFVRPQDRPEVGGEALHQMMNSVNLLNKRLENIEERLEVSH